MPKTGEKILAQGISKVSERVRGVVGAVVYGFKPAWTDRSPISPRDLGYEPAPSKSRFVEHSFTSDAGSREYKVYIPSRVTTIRSLVVMLHGCGQSPNDFAVGTRMNELAEAEGFIVAYPAQTSRAHGQRCWNWYQVVDQTRGFGEAEIVAGITRSVIADYKINPQRVYIAGLSAGGAAAANVARAYPDIYAALGVHSGLAAGCANDLPSALTVMRLGPVALNSCDLTPAALRMPTIVIRGESDATVHPSNSDQILTQAGADFLDASSQTDVSAGGMSYTLTRYADAAGHVRVESWVVKGLGHAWSGGATSGSHTDPRGPDASKAMIDFFLDRRLESVIKPQPK